MINNKSIWNTEKSSQFLSSPTKDLLLNTKNFHLTKKVEFLDETWNFSYLYHPEIHYSQIFDFTIIESKIYKLILKKHILQELLISRKRMITVWGSFYYIRRFLLYLETQNVNNAEDINIVDIEDFLNKLNYTNHSTRYKMKFALQNFFTICFDLRLNNNVQEINNYLDNYYSWDNEKKYIKHGTTPTIPKEIQNKLIKNALEDLKNPDRTLNNRIAAGMIIILFYTGMRNRELRLLQADQLEEISIFSNTESAFILNFKTFKTIGNGEARWTKAKAFPDLVKAYKMIEKLTKKRREQFNSNFLFLTVNGNIMGKSQSYYMIDNFLYRHQREIGILDLSNEEQQLLRKKKFTYGHYRTYGHQKESTQIDDYFYSISSHQFRVAFANNLKDKVSLEWVQEHMNHISLEMTKYYFRDDYEIRETLLYKSNKDGSQLEKAQYDELNDHEMIEACDTINKFLLENKLNIYTDLDDILERFSNNPLNESLIGLCSKAVILICERQDKLNIIEKWYYNAPSIPTLESIDFTIKRFFEKCKIVDHNKSLTAKNKMYIRNYEVEFESLKRFHKNRLLPELDLLHQELRSKEKEDLIIEVPILKDIIYNIDKLVKEVNQWEMKLILIPE